MAASFADDFFIGIFLNGDFRISNKISLKHVPCGLIVNKPSLVQIMGCRRKGDNPLSEPVMDTVPRRINVSLGLSGLIKQVKSHFKGLLILPKGIIYTDKVTSQQCKRQNNSNMPWTPHETPYVIYSLRQKQFLNHEYLIE